MALLPRCPWWLGNEGWESLCRPGGHRRQGLQGRWWGRKRGPKSRCTLPATWRPSACSSGVPNITVLVHWFGQGHFNGRTRPAPVVDSMKKHVRRYEDSQVWLSPSNTSPSKGVQSICCRVYYFTYLFEWKMLPVMSVNKGCCNQQAITLQLPPVVTSKDGKEQDTGPRY